MKKILVSLLVLSGLFFSNSCSNDFDLVTDWKDIPVVYALVSTADTAHYIRLEKAFLDPETSAIELAKVPDSIYYSNATVKLVNTDDDREYIFTKVDGNLEGYQREPGVFADSPNWLYKLKTNGIDTLIPGTEYQLIVNREESSTSVPVTATAVMLSNIEIKKPEPSSQIDFYTSPSSSSGELPQPSNPTVRWIFNEDNSFVFNVNLTFFYDEIKDGVTENKSFVWNVATNVRPENTESFRLDMETVAFYKTVAANIAEDLTAVRKFRKVNVEVIGGGEAFRDYLDVNQANIGLTSSQVIPNFTNMSEGYGIFSSVLSVSNDYFLKLQSRDSLRNGQYTEMLNFE